MNAVESLLLDSGWLDDPSWHEVARMADRLSVAQAAAARAELARVFDAEWTGTCTLRHPVAAKQKTLQGRFDLLELGHAVVDVGRDADAALMDRLRARLRDPSEFLGVAAELRAALLLRRSGALQNWGVPGDGRRLSECIARWPSGTRAVVEVKAFEMADDVRRAQRVVTTAIFEIFRLEGTRPGVRGRIDLNADAILDAPPDDAAVEQAVRDAMMMGQTWMNDPSTECVLPIRGVGAIHLVADPSRMSMDLQSGGFKPSNGATFRRLRRRASDALQQLATHPSLPGLLILDIDADGLARNGLNLLAGWVQKKRQLGAVVVIGREHSVDRGYGNVRLLPGPRYDEVANIVTALELCDAGHVHYQPMASLVGPCPACFWLESVAI